MSEDLFRHIKTRDDAPAGTFVIGIEKLVDTEYLFHVTLQLHNQPSPVADTEELYSQVIPAAKNFDAELHAPTPLTQLVLDALGDANLEEMPLFDYTKGVQIGISEEVQFSSFVRINLEDDENGWQFLSILRMTKLLARTLNPEKPTCVVTLSV